MKGILFCRLHISLHASVFHSQEEQEKNIKKNKKKTGYDKQGELIFDEDSLDTKLTHCSIIFICYFLFFAT